MEKEINKKCYKCGTEQQLTGFHKDKSGKDGYRNICKLCVKEHDKKYNVDNPKTNNEKEVVRIRSKKWREDNLDKSRSNSKKWQKENPNKVKENKKKWNGVNPDYHKKRYINNPDKYIEWSMKWREANPDYYKKYCEDNSDKIKEVRKEQRKNNPHISAWRGVLKSSLIRLNKPKEGYTIDLLGYSAIQLKQHIESLFTDGMTWDNYGEWHVDHIKEVRNFDKHTSASIVNALSNLRPLWATTRVINGIIYEGNLNRKKY